MHKFLESHFQFKFLISYFVSRVNFKLPLNIDTNQKRNCYCFGKLWQMFLSLFLCFLSLPQVLTLWYVSLYLLLLNSKFRIGLSFLTPYKVPKQRFQYLDVDLSAFLAYSLPPSLSLKGFVLGRSFSLLLSPSVP